MQVLEGKPYPLGASWDGLGTNFAIFSEYADRVDLCLFDNIDGKREVAASVGVGISARIWGWGVGD